MGGKTIVTYPDVGLQVSFLQDLSSISYHLHHKHTRTYMVVEPFVARARLGFYGGLRSFSFTPTLILLIPDRKIHRTQKRLS